MMSMDSDSAIQNNMLVEDSAYEWAPKRWSYCSKPCGEGTKAKKNCCCFFYIRAVACLFVFVLTFVSSYLY